MILLGLKILVIITAAVLAWQDFKTRYVSILLLLVLLVLSLALYFFSTTTEVLVAGFFSNLIFLSVLLSLLWIYTKIRFKGEVSFFQEAFALGDIGFLLSVLPLFSLKGYVMFFTFSAFLAIIVTLILTKKSEVQKIQIPFVSYMSIILISILVLDCFSWEKFCFFTEDMLNF